MDIQRSITAQGTNSITIQTLTLTANSTQTHTNDIVAPGKTLSIGSPGGVYVLNNNATDKNRITTYTGPGTTLIHSNIADNAGAVAADSKSLIAMGGTGTLVLTGTNTYQGGTRITGLGTLQLGDGGTTGSLQPGNDLTPVVNGTAAGTLAFKRSDDVTSTVASNGLLGIAQRGSGDLTLANSQFNTGANTVGDGVSASRLIVNAGAVAGSSTTGATIGTVLSGAPGRVNYPGRCRHCVEPRPQGRPASISHQWIGQRRHLHPFHCQ